MIDTSTSHRGLRVEIAEGWVVRYEILQVVTFYARRQLQAMEMGIYR